jgi:hypothetical protein
MQIPADKDLFFTTVIKAHEPIYLDLPLDVIILAKDLYGANHILKHCVRGYRHNRDYYLKKLDKGFWFDIPFNQQTKLLGSGYIIYDNDEDTIWLRK